MMRCARLMRRASGNSAECERQAHRSSPDEIARQIYFVARRRRQIRRRGNRWLRRHSNRARHRSARLKKNLQPQADAQKRYAAVDGVHERRTEMFFVQGANQRGVMTDAGEEQGFRFGNTFWRSRAVRFSAEPLESAFDGGHIAGAIVEDGNFHSSPLVLGKTLRRRLSRETAKRSARANALKMAST